MSKPPSKKSKRVHVGDKGTGSSSVPVVVDEMSVNEPQPVEKFQPVEEPQTLAKSETVEGSQPVEELQAIEEAQALVKSESVAKPIPLTEGKPVVKPQLVAEPQNTTVETATAQCPCESTTPPKPPITIDFDYFPSIRDNIIAQADGAALNRLRSLSRDMKRRADGRFVRHIELEHHPVEGEIYRASGGGPQLSEEWVNDRVMQRWIRCVDFYPPREHCTRSARDIQTSHLTARTVFIATATATPDTPPTFTFTAATPTTPLPPPVIAPVCTCFGVLSYHLGFCARTLPWVSVTRLRATRPGPAEVLPNAQWTVTHRFLPKSATFLTGPRLATHNALANFEYDPRGTNEWLRPRSVRPHAHRIWIRIKILPGYTPSPTVGPAATWVATMFFKEVFEDLDRLLLCRQILFIDVDTWGPVFGLPVGVSPRNLLEAELCLRGWTWPEHVHTLQCHLTRLANSLVTAGRRVPAEFVSIDDLKREVGNAQAALILDD